MKFHLSGWIDHRDLRNLTESLQCRNQPFDVIPTLFLWVNPQHTDSKNCRKIDIMIEVFKEEK